MLDTGEPVPTNSVPQTLEKKPDAPVTISMPISPEKTAQKLALRQAQEFRESYNASVGKTSGKLTSLTVPQNNAYKGLSEEAKAALSKLLGDEEAKETEERKQKAIIEEERLKTSAAGVAKHFFEGFYKVHGYYPSVVEITSGSIRNEAFRNLSEYARDELLKLAHEQEERK